MKAVDLLERMGEGERPTGICVRGVWRWTVGRENEPCGRAVNALVKAGLADNIYFSGGRAACNLTDAGRAQARIAEGF